MLARCVIALLTCLLAVGSASGGVEFELSDGQRDLIGGEVCFYRSAVTASDISPDKYYFSSGDVRCFPSRTILDMPAGRFLIFARHPDGYVSANRLMRYDAVPTSDECYQKLQINLRQSARIEFSNIRKAPDSRFGVWVDDTDQTLSTFLPAIPGESWIDVPAGVTIVPFEIRSNHLRRLGSPLRLNPGERHEIADLPSQKGRGDVVAWIEGRDEEVRNFAKAGRIFPDVSAVLTASNGEMFRSVTQPRHPGSYTGTLLIFKDVPAGKATIVSSGRFWSSDRSDVEVPDGGLTITSKPLVVLPASTVLVSLPIGVDTNLRIGTCEKAVRPQVAAILRRCADRGSDADSASCPIVREITAEPSPKGIEFTGVVGGQYIVEVRPPHGRTFTEKVTARPGEEAAVSVQDVGPILFGTVRRGSQPLRAQLRFATDDTAITSESGTYRTLLKGDPGVHPVEINLCDGGTYIHVPERPPTPFESFDIEIPDNTLTGIVRDALSGEPIAKARVKYGVLKNPEDDDPESFSVLYSQSVSSDERGEAKFEGVVPKRTVRVCANATGYKAVCSDRILTPNKGEGKVELSLRRLGMLRGSVRSLAPLDHARVFLLSHVGHVLAEAIVQSDGTFVYDPVPLHGYAAVISPTLPLTLVRLSPPAEGSDLVVTLPEARARRFRITTDPPRNARVGLVIGGVVIPSRVFFMHQHVHGLQSVLFNTPTLEVAEIAETAEIVAVLGQDPDDSSFPPDAAGRPEYVAGFPSRPLPGNSDLIVFN